jgi:hypothetical protein
MPKKNNGMFAFLVSVRKEVLPGIERWQQDFEQRTGAPISRNGAICAMIVQAIRALDEPSDSR